MIALVGVLTAAVIVGLATRYDYRRNGNLYWRIDRWTGSLEYYNYPGRTWESL